jgi:hypothetical protein
LCTVRYKNKQSVFKFLNCFFQYINVLLLVRKQLLLFLRITYIQTFKPSKKFFGPYFLNIYVKSRTNSEIDGKFIEFEPASGKKSSGSAIFWAKRLLNVFCYILWRNKFVFADVAPLSIFLLFSDLKDHGPPGSRVWGTSKLFFKI